MLRHTKKFINQVAQSQKLKTGQINIFFGNPVVDIMTENQCWKYFSWSTNHILIQDSLMHSEACRKYFAISTKVNEDKYCPKTKINNILQSFEHYLL